MIFLFSYSCFLGTNTSPNYIILTMPFLSQPVPKSKTYRIPGSPDITPGYISRQRLCFMKLRTTTDNLFWRSLSSDRFLRLFPIEILGYLLKGQKLDGNTALHSASTQVLVANPALYPASIDIDMWPQVVPLIISIRHYFAGVFSRVLTIFRFCAIVTYDQSVSTNSTQKYKSASPCCMRPTSPSTGEARSVSTPTRTTMKRQYDLRTLAKR